MPGRLEPKDRALIIEHGDVPIIDTSTRRLFHHCPRKFAWMAPAPFGLGLRPKKTVPALLFGTLVHEALDAYYGNGDDPAVHFLDHAESRIDEILRTEAKLWPEQLEDLGKLKALGHDMLQEYLPYAMAHDDFEVVVTERGALVPVLHPGGVEWRDGGYGDRYPVPTTAGDVAALYYVRFDGIVKDDRGRLWVMEHKTCARWWSDTQLQLDLQVAAYAWAAEQWYGQKIAGVLMNFLLKEPVRDPPILKSGRPTEDWRKLTYVTHDRYCKALEALDYFNWPSRQRDTVGYEDILERLRVRDETQHPTIRRVKVEINRHQIEQAGRRILRDVLRMTSPNRPGVDDPAPSFTCGSCPMRDPCLLADVGADHTYTLAQLYEERPPIWDDEVSNGDD